MAFPQFLTVIEEVIVVSPEGRYIPAAKPRKTRPILIAQGVLLAAMKSRAIPVTADDKAIVFLWVSNKDRYPDPTSEIQYPREIRRKKLPASA
jgi:hypothetical protein